MNRGLILKTLRETWPWTLLFALAVGGVEVLLAHILPTFFGEGSAAFLQFGFFRTILEGLLGTEVGSALGPEMVTSIAWVHPLVMTLIWAHAIWFCTRVPAGEVDRGTVDVLLSLPVSRTRLYVCESAVWAVAGLAVVTMALVGNLIGGRFAPPELRGTPRQLIVVVVNLFCLYLVVGSATLLVSALSDRRGRAVGAAIAFILLSTLVDSLAPFWEPAGRVAFLCITSYYWPLPILQGEPWPVADMLVLTAVAIGCWLGAAVVFVRRDLRTG